MPITCITYLFIIESWAVADQDIGGDRNQWWYCPKAQKCVLSFRDCDMSTKTRELGPSQVTSYLSRVY